MKNRGDPSGSIGGSPAVQRPASNPPYGGVEAAAATSALFHPFPPARPHLSPNRCLVTFYFLDMFLRGFPVILDGLEGDSLLGILLIRIKLDSKLVFELPAGTIRGKFNLVSIPASLSTKACGRRRRRSRRRRRRR